MPPGQPRGRLLHIDRVIGIQPRQHGQRLATNMRGRPARSVARGDLSEAGADEPHPSPRRPGWVRSPPPSHLPVGAIGEPSPRSPRCRPSRRPLRPPSAPPGHPRVPNPGPRDPVRRTRTPTHRGGWPPSGRPDPTGRRAGPRTTTPGPAAPGCRRQDRGPTSRLEVLAGHLQGIGRDIGGPDLDGREPASALGGQGQGDGTRAGAEIHAHRSRTRPCGGSGGPSANHRAPTDLRPARPTPPRPPARSRAGGSAPGDQPSAPASGTASGPARTAVVHRPPAGPPVPPPGGSARRRTTDEPRMPHSASTCSRIHRASRTEPSRSAADASNAGRRSSRSVVTGPPGADDRRHLNPRPAGGRACPPSRRRSGRRGPPSGCGRVCAG